MVRIIQYSKNGTFTDYTSMQKGNIKKLCGPELESPVCLLLVARNRLIICFEVRTV